MSTCNAKHPKTGRACQVLSDLPKHFSAHAYRDFAAGRRMCWDDEGDTWDEYLPGGVRSRAENNALSEAGDRAAYEWGRGINDERPEGRVWRWW